MAMNCPTCQHPAEEGDLHCDQCGREISSAPTAAPPNTKKCPYCAEDIKAEAVVCRFCNRELSAASKNQQVSPDENKRLAASTPTAPPSTPKARTAEEFISHLDPSEVLVVESRRSREKKSTVIAYLLWFFLGGIGVHKFYLRDPLWGVFYIACVILVLPTAFISAIPLSICLLVDLFTIPGRIKALDEKALKEALVSIGKPWQKGIS